MAGWRGAGGERRPFGRPGERPQGCGAAAREPSVSSSAATVRRTRQGVSRPGGSGRPHGSRRSAAHARARRNWV